jgi:hypothetical protein
VGDVLVVAVIVRSSTRSSSSRTTSNGPAPATRRSIAGTTGGIPPSMCRLRTLVLLLRGGSPTPFRRVGRRPGGGLIRRPTRAPFPAHAGGNGPPVFGDPPGRSSLPAGGPVLPPRSTARWGRGPDVLFPPESVLVVGWWVGRAPFPLPPTVVFRVRR